MADNHDYVALDWVRGEIEQTLSQARTALEAYVESAEDTTQLTFCLNYIHQVYGTLQMVEFYGAALLAEEMEHLCQSMIDEQVPNREESLEVLMGSLLQLENYLEHIQTGQKDLPVVLLPTLNDLRAAQGRPLLSDTSLFTPDLSPADIAPDDKNNARMQDPQVVANLRKLRQMYQISLVGVIRGQDLAENLSYLYKVLARLEKFCHDTPIGKIWWVSVGFLDAIQGHEDGLGSATKHLLRGLDHLMKEMIEHPEDILSRPLPVDLLKNMLYYIAKANNSTKRVEDLRSAFNLEQALPSEEELDAERQKLQGPDQDTMSSVVTALGDELSQVKDQLDLFVRNKNQDQESLSELVPTLHQVANTLAVLGHGGDRGKVLAQIERIENIVASGEQPDDQILLDIAGALLQVEASLSTAGRGDSGSDSDNPDEFVVPTEQFQSAHNAVIVESKNGLEQAKNSIVGFIASQWDHAEIEDVPELLDSIRGGLQIIPLDRAARLLGNCSAFIRDQLLESKAVPDWEQLDRLADAITSIEYYMERLTAGASGNEKILDMAEESLSKLGAQNLSAGESEPVMSEHHTAEVAAESPEATVKSSDESLIDEEILEIFVEEVDEVLHAVSDAMEKLRNDPEESDSLKELRRAFHTLKGSGRLVGAIDIGETGWAIENLLNKYIEQNRGLEFEDLSLLDLAQARLPALVEDFSKQTQNTEFEDIIRLAEGRLSALMGTPSPQQEAPTAKEDNQEQKSEPDPEEVPQVDAEQLDEPTDERDTPEPLPEEPEDDLIDDEILEIFIEEAEEVSETIDNFLPGFLDEFENQEALTELRRAYHTLKGSGRMVGASDIGETAWAIENMLNRVIDGSILMSQDIADILKYVSGIIPELVGNFRERTLPEYDLEKIQAHAEALSKGDLVPALSTLTLKRSDSGEAPESEAQSDESELGIDEALIDIFESEVSGHVKTVENFIAQAQSSDEALSIDDALSRALHTLKGSAKTASIDSIAEVAIPTEKFVKEARARLIPVDESIAGLLSEAIELIREGLDKLKTSPKESLSGTEDYLNRLSDLSHTEFTDLSEDEELEGAAGQDPQLVNIFLTEGLDILLDAEKILGEWQDNPVSDESLEKLVGEVKTLHRGAKIAGLDSIAELCDAIEGCYACVETSQLPEGSLLSDVKRGHEVLIDMMDQVAAGLSAVPDQALLEALRSHHAAQDKAEDPLNTRIDELQKELDDVIPDLQKEDALSAQESDLVPEQAGDQVPESNAAQAVADEPISEELDDELIEIFLDEARDILAGLPAAIAQIQLPDPSEQALQQLERDFHTLKGGARMATIAPVGDLANAAENLFNQLVCKQLPVTQSLFPLLEEAAATLADLLQALEQKSGLANVEELVNALKAYDGTTLTEEPAEADSPAVAQEPELEPEPEPEPEPELQSVSPLMDLDPELVEIFLEEARDIIDNSGSLLHQWESDTHNLDLVAELQRELHTLKGGARMAEVSLIGDISHELETLFERIVDSRFEVQPGMIQLCLRCHDALANMVEALAEGRGIPDATELLEQIKAVVETGQSEGSGSEAAYQPPVVADIEADSADDVPDSEMESDLLSLFLEESKDILTSISEFLDQWVEGVSGDTIALELQREFHTLKGGARLADIDAIADLAEASENRLSLYISGDQSGREAIIEVLHQAHESLSAMLGQLSEGNVVNADGELAHRISFAGLPNAAQETAVASSAQAGPTDAELDLEVLEIFVEEARELSEALEEQIAAWAETPANQDINREIQRILHTLKGGARLSDLSELADESHDLETLLVSSLNDNADFEGELKQQVTERQDRILKLVDGLQLKLQGKEIEPEPAKVEPPVAKTEKKDSSKKSAKTASAKTTKKKTAKPAEKAKKAVETEIAKPAPEPAKVEPGKVTPQETIRVSSGVIEELINLAGETSISRGRLETQISDFGFTLEEMSATIERLREQLRRMEMETEAQVLFRAEKEGFAGTDYDDFDPLEMDRYSSIQQLSRSLTESTTDLMELRESLADRARGAETLLLQQSRINSELQENLMKTRMIPFSSMVPRLRRIARQISAELDKQVNFDVSNAEGEMDRSILERMIAPLEHMLRNALDHGLESGEERVKAGKSEIGNVRLSLSREGGDVVIRMADDGGGINDQKILEKAVSQGLVKQDAHASRHDILQFIMLPGFSTAEKVTQISGRGVGMDVVASEIKQMGGSIEIDSTIGQGTEFTVRLPFTVSVNRALMVNTGDDFYAIPLNTIEGIVRVSPFELEEYYKPNAPLYEYAGRKYKLKYLGKLLHTGHQPKLQGQPLPLPVILVRGTDSPMALQVDSLMGSREIVVKSLGPQFGGVHAVSGATILGDGSVVVILDLPALIRDESAGILDSAEEIGVHVEKDADTPLVMVIDDSVTVRKVTTRLLERNGMEVVTAKDGVDAIAQLQDIKPDVMLLDIEMPRMDGFEVATLVRHDERLKEVPIIMITSRTGQKHRDRAMAIGVNEYLGKPFQEQELLETIEKMTELK
ncbi:MAG: hybrid sensor histidine kinase/response regulator [Oleiphilus sp.]|nr:MAG: hybrid sensor histidine kinase/response regulator [Oleiphilus sp.]